MTLEEAINYHEEVAEKNDVDAEYYELKFSYRRIDYYQKKIDSCRECANDHRQLAEWLRELKAYREAVKEIKAYASIWMEWNEGMSKHEIAEKAMTDAKEGFIAIVEKHLKEVNADEDCD